LRLRRCIFVVRLLERWIFRPYWSGLTLVTSFLYASLTMTHLSNAAKAHLPERRRTLSGTRARSRLIPAVGCRRIGGKSISMLRRDSQRRPRINRAV